MRVALGRRVEARGLKRKGSAASICTVCSSARVLVAAAQSSTLTVSGGERCDHLWSRWVRVRDSESCREVLVSGPVAFKPVPGPSQLPQGPKVSLKKETQIFLRAPACAVRLRHATTAHNSSQAPDTPRLDPWPPLHPSPFTLSLPTRGGNAPSAVGRRVGGELRVHPLRAVQQPLCRGGESAVPITCKRHKRRPCSELLASPSELSASPSELLAWSLTAMQHGSPRRNQHRVVPRLGVAPPQHVSHHRRLRDPPRSKEVRGGCGRKRW
jgi:hypothetical protein